MQNVLYRIAERARNQDSGVGDRTTDSRTDRCSPQSGSAAPVVKTVREKKCTKSHLAGTTRLLVSHPEPRHESHFKQCSTETSSCRYALALGLSQPQQIPLNVPRIGGENDESRVNSSTRQFGYAAPSTNFETTENTEIMEN